MELALSTRAARMPSSPIRKLAPFADAAKAQGVKVFHLNIGQPDVPSPPLFWDAIKQIDLRVLEYSHSAGAIPLRQRVAELYTKSGLNVTSDQVMVTIAGSEAISFAMMAICDPGDEIIVPEPMYANYLGFAAAIGVTIIPLPTMIEDNFALPGIEKFAEKISPRTKAILINNPGNPTGTVYSDDQLASLRDLALDRGLYLLADEVYREFSYLGRRPTSILELDGIDEQVIMIDSVSKRFSLCGARIGFLVCRNERMMDAAFKFAQARLAPPTLEMLGVLAALETPQAYFDEMRAEYQRRRDTLVAGIQSIPGSLCPRIDGAFYATVRLPIDNTDRYCQWLLEEFRVHNETVMLAPATGFYGTPGMGVDEVRIAYVLKNKDMERAIGIIQESLKAYPGRTNA